ncbi:MAG: sulfite exporter TauE/SafE family protein [Gammaproteobacteria bacterium]|nr:sulfite exporter TauE/SafE family protein [Gammaproteobacteria bacterium]
MIETNLILVFAGLCAGVLAGLLGVGGGLVMVPVLTYLYAGAFGGVANAMPYALGTSLATIVFTGCVSAYSHHKRGAVTWTVVGTLVPGLVVGTLAAAVLASRVSGEALRIFFGLFVIVAAWQMWSNKRPHASRTLPTRNGYNVAGTMIGVVSGLVGIGGGTLTVPYLIWHGMQAQRAVAISAACGIAIAIAGTVGYAWSGPGITTTAYTTGFIIWPAVAMLAVGSMAMAPVGAALAHRLPAQRLKRMFAVFLTVIAIRMLLS